MKINALTGSRAIAAIMVVILHYGVNVFPFTLCPKLFSSGNLSVSYFFVLSGFVLFVSQSHIHYGTFIAKRFLRLAPAYYIALGLTAWFFCYYYPVPQEFNLQLLYSALFLHAWFPHYVLELNGPSWSLCVEMVFYLLFPILLRLSRYAKLFIIATALLYISSQIVHLAYCNAYGPLSGNGIYFNPLIHMHEFMAGIVGGMLYKEKPVVFRQRFLSASLLCLIIFLIIIRTEAVSYAAGLIAPLFMLLIVSMAVNGVSWLEGSIPVFIGEISYGIYIYQLPIFKFVAMMNKEYLHFPAPVVFYSGLSSLILVSAVSYLFVERPLTRVFKPKVKRINFERAC